MLAAFMHAGPSTFTGEPGKRMCTTLRHVLSVSNGSSVRFVLILLAGGLIGTLPRCFSLRTEIIIGSFGQRSRISSSYITYAYLLALNNPTIAPQCNNLQEPCLYTAAQQKHEFAHLVPMVHDDASQVCKRARGGKRALQVGAV